MKSKLILASASPRRLDLLKQIHITPDDVIPAGLDEAEHKGEKPRDSAIRLATEKAQAVAAKHKEAYILAADTIVACGRRILPKTETKEQAQACLSLLSGRRHNVYGGIALIAPNGQLTRKVCETVVQFKSLSNAELVFYLETEEWKDVAGGYAIQGYAASFIKFMRGSYSNVVGLSLYDTMKILNGAGFSRG